MNIIPLMPIHLDEVALLEQQCFSVPWSRAMLAEELLCDYAYYFAAEDDDGTVMGYGGLHVAQDMAYITNIATAERHRRRGVAAAVLDKMLQSAAEAGAETITLEVRESNEAARQLYKSRGFEDIALRKDYYVLPVEDAVVMLKVLNRKKVEDNENFSN